MAESDYVGDLNPVQAFLSGCFWELPSENTQSKFLPCIHALCKDCIDKNDSHEDRRHNDTSRYTYECKICNLEVQQQTQVDFAAELHEMICQVLRLCMKVFDIKISCGKCGGWLFSYAHYCEQCRCRLCLSCKQRHMSSHKVSLLPTHVLNKKFDRGHWSHERPLEIHCVGCAKSSCITCFIENDRTASTLINSDYEKTKREMSLLKKNLGERKEQLCHERQCIRHDEEFLANEIDQQVNDFKNRLNMWVKELKEQIKLNFEEKSVALDSEIKQAKQRLATLDDKVLNLSILQGKDIVDYLCKRKYFSCLKDEYNEWSQQDCLKSHLCFKVSNILHLSNEDIFGTLQGIGFCLYLVLLDFA